MKPSPVTNKKLETRSTTVGFRAGETRKAVVRNVKRVHRKTTASVFYVTKYMNTSTGGVHGYFVLICMHI